MKELGLRRVVRGARRADVDDADRAIFVDRNFSATRPNELWVSDLTYVSTWRGFVYVAAQRSRAGRAGAGPL